MSNYKINDYITKEFNGIIQDGGEYRAYILGIANGFYHCYKNYKLVNGKEITNEIFQPFFQSNGKEYDYFRKLVELSEQENSKKDDLLEKIHRKRD